MATFSAHSSHSKHSDNVFFLLGVNFVNGMSSNTKTYHLKYHEMKASCFQATGTLTELQKMCYAQAQHQQLKDEYGTTHKKEDYWWNISLSND